MFWNGGVNVLPNLHNVRRFMKVLGIKQDALAADFRNDPTILKLVSAALKIPIEAIENFDEDSVINIISNTGNNNDNANDNSPFSYYPTINPIEKLVQLEKKIALYERMVKEKDEMMARLEKLFEK